MNNNRPKGNHKHLTQSDRIEIEKGLGNRESFRTIAKKLGKDPSTISKEVRLHSEFVRRTGIKAKTPIPCANNYNPNNKRASACIEVQVCGDTGCLKKCVCCSKFKCSAVCSKYVPRTCELLDKPPYVCNGCANKTNCLLENKLYSSKYAQDCYESLLSSSREGINQSPEAIQKMNDIISPLIKKGQSIAHIYATHADELNCSKRTVYTYIDHCVFDARNIDLRRKVKYKPRKKSTTTPVKDRLFRKNRGYADFLKYVETECPQYIVEMDTVEGQKGSLPCFLTMLFRNCNLMLIFLLKEQSQEEVKRVFEELTKTLGIELFQKMFQVILTDNGHEFQDRWALECDEYGEIRTRIYYCDPNRSDQKGALEKNHKYIRYVLPKGVPFTMMTDSKTLTLMNHINSEKRDSLNGHSPYEVSRILLDNRFHDLLGLVEIAADDVMLTPDLIK